MNLRLLMAGAILVALTAALVPATATAAPSTKPIITVIGDSMSEPRPSGAYNDVSRHRMQAWWSILRKQKKMRVRVHARGGSGYTRGGPYCGGTTFADRVKDASVAKDIARSRVVIIAGGVNDAMSCDPAVTITSATTATMEAVRQTNPTARIVVIAPWGDHQWNKGHKSRTVAAIKAAARKHRATYVPMPLREDRTMDRVHTNRAGNVYIARKIGPYVR